LSKKGKLYQEFRLVGQNTRENAQYAQFAFAGEGGSHRKVRVFQETAT
jgi:hypothetical protein